MSRIKTMLLYVYRKFWCELSKINPVFATKLLYKKNVGRRLDINNPKSLTEKLQWLKLYKYYHNPVVTKCIDKYSVREYVIEHGCEPILNELYGVWDKTEDIDWENLPNRFVLKCTHGCGYNIICKDKNSFNIKNAKEKLDLWMNEKYGYENAEMIYSDIIPKIICERYIDAEGGRDLLDYKIFCSYGEPKLIYVITGGHGQGECLDYYTIDWEWIPVNNGTLPNAGDIIKKPKCLDAMLDYASKLSKDFPIVRVDLYCEYGQIIFGELTFLATGGMSRYEPCKYDFEFGALFNIDVDKNIKFSIY